MNETINELISKNIEPNCFYVVGTPIGNMGDITLRALATLSQVDTIVAEDNRTSGILLSRFGIKKPMITFHAKSTKNDIEKIITKLEKGESLAYISDAGTPSISDPGNLIVQIIKDRLPEIKISPIPGASALTSALSVSGISGNKFFFAGFPPQKKGRNKFFEEISSLEETIVLYESPHRIEKTLSEIKNTFGENTVVTVGREITKQFEQFIQGEVSVVLEHEKIKNPKGEYVVMIWGKK